MRSRRAQPELPPSHESGVRRMVADAISGRYEAFRSLEEARAAQDAAVVMEGDDGGSIYLTCPIGLVNCDEQALRQLLKTSGNALSRHWQVAAGASP